MNEKNIPYMEPASAPITVIVASGQDLVVMDDTGHLLFHRYPEGPSPNPSRSLSPNPSPIGRGLPENTESNKTPLPMGEGQGERLQSPLPMGVGQEERLKSCITELMGIAGKKRGKWLFCQANHWQMIYRILVDRGLMPSSYKAFTDCIERMGNDFRIPCSYEMVKDIDDVFAKPFKQWELRLYHGKRASSYYQKYEIARRFAEIVDAVIEH